MTKKKQSRGKAPARLETQLCFAIYGAAHALTRTYKPLLEPLGLTYPQYLVMLVLWEEDDQSVRAIGDRLGLDSGTLSPLLKRLEQGGVVSRKRDSQDERLVRISLTRKGQDLASQAIDVTRAIAEATQCSLEEMEGLRDRLRALTGRLQEQPT